MGDRCWLQVTVHRNHVDEFWKAVDDDPKYAESEEDEWGNMRYQIDEANYGWSDQLDAAAAQGCVFEGDHGAGGEYGPHSFASQGDGLCHCVETDHDMTPVVPCPEGGPDGRYVAVVADYWRVYRRVRELLERTGATELRRIVDGHQTTETR